MSIACPHVVQRDVCKPATDKLVIVSVSPTSNFGRAATRATLYSFSFNYLTRTQVDHSCFVVLNGTSGLSEKQVSFENLGITAKHYTSSTLEQTLLVREAVLSELEAYRYCP